MNNKHFILGAGILGLGLSVSATFAAQLTLTSSEVTHTSTSPFTQISLLSKEGTTQHLEHMKEGLAQALNDGKLTQEQYDEMITNLESGEFPLMKRRGEWPKLQITELSEEQKSEMREHMKEKLATELTNNQITQEQYDEMITNLENDEFPLMKGRNRGFGFHMMELSEEQKLEMIEQIKERLATELANNQITQEQYDKMIASLENGEFPVMKGRGHPAEGRGHHWENNISFSLQTLNS